MNIPLLSIVILAYRGNRGRGIDRALQGKDLGGEPYANPDKASSSKDILVVPGEHIDTDVDMPELGKYTFKAEIEPGAEKGSATFFYMFK